MAKALVGVGGTPRNISEIYLGVNGARRSCTEAYVGVNGAPRLCWSGNKWANKLCVVCRQDANNVGLHIFDPLTSARTPLKIVPDTDRASTFAQNFIGRVPVGGVKYFYGWRVSSVLTQIDPDTYAVTQQITVPYYRTYYLDWGLRSLIAIPDGSGLIKRYDPKTLALINEMDGAYSATGYSSDDTLFSVVPRSSTIRDIDKIVYTQIPYPSKYTRTLHVSQVSLHQSYSGTTLTVGKHYLVYFWLGADYVPTVSTYDKNTGALIKQFDKPFNLYYTSTLFDFMKE